MKFSFASLCGLPTSQEATTSATPEPAIDVGTSSALHTGQTPLAPRRRSGNESDGGSGSVQFRTSILPPRLRNALDLLTAKDLRRQAASMELPQVEQLLQSPEMLKGRCTRALQKRRSELLQESGGGAATAAPSALKKAAEKLDDVLYLHGAGITQTTVTPHPFRSVTTSASPKMISTVRADGQDAPAIPQALAVQMTAPSATPERPAKELPALLQDMDKPVDLARLVRRAFTGTPAEKAALVTQLSEGRQVAQLGNMETAQLVKALAVSFPDAARAGQALQGLRDVSLANDIRRPAAVADVAPATQLAWKFASELESVPGIGLDLLDTLTDRPRGHPEAGRRAAMTKAERGLVRAYLRAATDVARAGPDDRRVDPGAIYGRGQVHEAIHAARRLQGPGAWPGRAGSATPPSVALKLSEKALLAIPEGLDPSATERHGCEFAVHMLRAGMPTDKRHNVDGSVSEFHKAESRAVKTTGKHLDRALRDRVGNPLKSALERYVLRKGKSPFFAHDALTSGRGLNRGFGLSHRGGMQEGRAIKDMMDVLEQGLMMAGGPHGAPLLNAQGHVDAPSLDDETLRNLVRLAMLKTAKAKIVLIPRFARGDELSGPALHAAHDTVMAMVRPSPQAGTSDMEGLAKRVEEALRHENVRLTPTALLRWAADAGGPDSEESLAEYRDGPPEEGQPDWSAFAKNFGRSMGKDLPSVPTPALAGATRAQAADMLAEMVAGEELGSGFSLSNLGTTHFTTRNISEVITALATKGTAALRLDLGGGQRRMVTFESGVNAECSYLRMAVATVRMGQVGIGGSIGPAVGVKGAARFSLSVGGDVQDSAELLAQEGVTFNFPRHLNGGLAGDSAAAQKKAQLLRLLIDVAGGEAGEGVLARPGNPEDQGSLVKAAYQAFGNTISVGAFKIRQNDHRVTGSTTVGAGAGVSQLGVSVGLPSLRNSGQVNLGAIDYEDTSGTVRVKRQTESVLFRATADAVLGSFTALIPGPGNDPQAFSQAVASGTQPDLQSFTAVGSGALAGVSADYLRLGRTNIVNRTLDEDKQLPTSYGLSTFSDPASFIHALAADFKTCAHDKAKKYAAADYHAHAQATVDNEARLIAEYAGKVLQDKDRTTLPNLYWEFGDDVSAMNHLMAEEYLAGRQGDKMRAKEAGRQLAALHADPAWHEARFVSSSNVRSASERVGVNGLLGITHNIENRVSERVLGFT